MFESAKLKVERANYHIDGLKITINNFLTENEKSIFSHGNPEGGNGSIGIAPLPAPPIFNIIVGDIAHNLRSALDHVAGEITSLSTGGCQKAISVSKFPISTVVKDFQSSVAKHIEPHDPEVAAALLREMENSDTWFQVINAINLLNNTDKHRAVVVVITSVGIAAEGIRTGGISVGKIESLDGGFLISNFGGQPLQFDKKPYPTILVAFDDGENFDGRSVIDQLVEASGIVARTIHICEQNSRFRGS